MASALIPFCVAAACCTLTAAFAVAQSYSGNPDSARLAVEDVRRLASVLRSLERGGDTVALLERDYFAHATPGLRAYAERYAVTPATLSEAIARDPASYADLDRLADAIVARTDTFRAAFRKLRELYPQAVFPPVWFVAGHLGPAGVSRPVGPLIAAENYVDNVDDLVPLALHELTHFQQAMVQGVETVPPHLRPGADAPRARAPRRLRRVHYGAGRGAVHQSRCRGVRASARAGRCGSAFGTICTSASPAIGCSSSRRTPNGRWDLGYWIGKRIVQSYCEAGAGQAAGYSRHSRPHRFSRLSRTQRILSQFRQEIEKSFHVARTMPADTR